MEENVSSETRTAAMTAFCLFRSVTIQFDEAPERLMILSRALGGDHRREPWISLRED